MRVFIAGGTGFIGRWLARSLRDVYVVGRRGPVRYEDLGRLVGDGDVVINLAGESIFGRWTPSKKRAILRSRVETTELLVRTIRDKDLHLFIQASAIGYYGFRVDKSACEDHPKGEGFLAEVCEEWERASSGVENRAVLRIGVVLGDGGMLKTLKLPFRLFLGGVPGSGENYISWIHISDVVGSVKFIINRRLTGIFNLTSPQPVRALDFYRELSKTLSRPLLFRIPPPVMRLAMGGFVDEVVLSDQRVIPCRLLKEGYEFKFVEVREALRASLE